MKTKNMTRRGKIIHHKTNELNGWKNVVKVFEDYFRKSETKEETK